ncbi:MAG: tRNA lysidine(34) synthetase TilS [Burkholderiaceae bacterium]
MAAAVLRALDAARATTDDSGPSKRRVAIAYSGGADSTALLRAASMLHHSRRIDVFAFHIHHGLAATADAWLEHCRAQAATFGVAFDAAHIAPLRPGVSVEAEARTLRYAALMQLCRQHGCSILMTAHHVDDQAETVLVNLARGAGVGGLAATARSRWIDDILLLRPLIDLPAATLRVYVATHALTHVEDPSNSDRRYTRNAIRHEVMPALRRIVPSIATRLAQTAAHASTMQQLLDDIGHEDLRHDASTPESEELDIDRLASLSDPRAANALRVWLALRGMRAPSAAALKEMLDQLLHASPDAQIALLHERQTLRLYRGHVSIDRGGRPQGAFRSLQWRGESRIEVPEWNGTLLFDASDERGFDALALREGPLVLRERRGGERLRARAEGPSRTLKNLYQEAGIAAWQRARLPLVYLAERLVFAAGLGPNAATTQEASSGVELVQIGWEPMS